MPNDKGSSRTEIQHLYKIEPPQEQWRDYESHLLNLTRKLTGEDRTEVYVYAERLALARINRRLGQKRVASATARRKAPGEEASA